MMIMRPIAPLLPVLAALLVLSPAGAQENPLLTPPPGLTGAPRPSDPAAAEQGRLQSDLLRPPAGLDARPDPDPMYDREMRERRLDAERMLRAQQEPQPPAVTVDGPAPPRNDPPATRITHGRAADKPTPVQSSPVPGRKPLPPSGP
ncbi:hypothetical protein [Niveispirillum fermenti]